MKEQFKTLDIRHKGQWFLREGTPNKQCAFKIAQAYNLEKKKVQVLAQEREISLGRDP